MSKVHSTHVINDDWALLAVSSMRSLGLREEIAEKLPQSPQGSVKRHLEDMTIRGLLVKDQGTYRIAAL